MPASMAPGQWPATSSLNFLPTSLPTAAAAEVHEHARTLSYISAQSAVETRDLRYLHHLVNVTRPKLTGETGFASGLSALAIMTALASDARHVAIDPFQPAFHLDGVRGAQRYARAKAARPAFHHLNETAAFGLAWLLKQRQVSLDTTLSACGERMRREAAHISHASLVRNLATRLLLAVL
jgi:hypothetical protein